MNNMLKSQVFIRLGNLADKVDYLIVGGGILNTFLLANGKNIGKSLFEIDLLDESRKIMQKMQVINNYKIISR